MTSTQSSGQILKTDSLARVKTPPARKRELLEEFDRSGLSGAKFAALAGIKYSTFATWAARRKRASPAEPASGAKVEGAAQVRWLEAVLDQAQGPVDKNASGLVVRLSGGARLEISDFHQIELASALLRALEKPSTSC
jgi:hypothetical protein